MPLHRFIRRAPHTILRTVRRHAPHEDPDAFHSLLRERDGPCGARPARCLASQYRWPAPAAEGVNHSNSFARGGMIGRVRRILLRPACSRRP
ncbi:hypothetical protein DF018_00570 [Burkholderia cenocepacia]|nr:hypothetical protein DF018_00570 [Burkholderia cenocepacia]